MGKIHTDTSEFFSIDGGDIIQVGEKQFKVTGHAREMRFGIEDPKFWVKRAVDIDTGDRKYIKLSFLETFKTKLGGLTIQCFRNPEKEGEILDLTRNHPYFMHGKVYRDDKNNNIRVLDIVHGENYLFYIDSFKMPYEEYYKKHLPSLLKDLVRLFEAIRVLHVNGYTHGDIRNDHVIRENHTGNLVWIDFDYDYSTSENPFSLDLYGLGNILCYTIGQGFHTYYHLKKESTRYGNLVEQLVPEDFSLLDQRRLYNLRKLYPMVPKTLNNILLHFSIGAEVAYESVEEIIEDLNRSLQAFY